MDKQERKERLLAELESLRALKKLSTVFDFESKGDPPDRYAVIFRGKGIAKDSAGRADVELLELHRCDIRLPYSYPDRAPDVRWLTPLFHPNVSFSGFINLRDIGLPWEKEMSLDVVCERLWDVALAAYLKLDKANNYAAKNWYDKDCTFRLPVDQRQLRDKSAPTGSNIIQYDRRGDRSVTLPGRENAGDVLFIGDDAPAATPLRPVPAQPLRPAPAPPRPAAREDDDILFIGD